MPIIISNRWLTVKTALADIDFDHVSIIPVHQAMLLWLMALILVIVSCDSGTNDITGPVEDVSYSADIQPIFTGSCGGAGCHLESSQSGVNLSSYSQVMSSTGQQYELEIVQPGEPYESPLVDKIEPNPQHGVRMPFAREPLSDRQIMEIRVWIEEGAADN